MGICNCRCINNSNQAKWTVEIPLQSQVWGALCYQIFKQCKPLLLTQQGTAAWVADSPVGPNREMRNRPKQIPDKGGISDHWGKSRLCTKWFWEDWLATGKVKSPLE